MKFVIKKSSEKLGAIVADINLKKMRARISTGYVVNLSDWDSDKEKVNNKAVNALLINKYLNLHRAKIDEYLAQATISNSDVSLENLKIAINSILHPDKPFKIKEAIIPKITTNLFFETFRNWIEKRKSSGKYSFSRIKRYNSIFNILSEFQEYNGEEITFHRMDKGFEEDFQSFLINKKKLVNNTIGSIVRVLKTFLKDMEKELGDKLNPDYKDFKAYKDPEPPTFALTNEELSLIENVELASDADKRVRDLFILQTYLLVRVSDLKQIQPEHIDKKKKIIRLTQIKSQHPVIIPIPKKCIDILENWNYAIPKISDQKYNEHIKRVAKFAGVDDLFEAVRYSGSRRIVETKPKYEIIASHTARRTGITLLIRKGIPLNIIMKISGHKKIETIMRYVKLTPDEAVEIVRKAWD